MISTKPDERAIEIALVKFGLVAIVLHAHDDETTNFEFRPLAEAHYETALAAVALELETVWWTASANDPIRCGARIDRVTVTKVADDFLVER